MRRFLRCVMPAIIAMTVVGCQSRTGLVTADHPVPERAIRDAWFDAPIFVRDSPYVLSPYSVEVDYGQIRSARMSESAAAASITVWQAPRIRWNNIAFTHVETGETHLLLDRRALITQFWYHDPKAEYSAKLPAVLIMGIVERDTTRDGLIDSRDNATGYISNISGKQMWRITPENTDMLHFSFDPSGRWLIVCIRRDRNKDGKFNEDDGSEYLIVDPLQPDIGRPLVSEDLREDARRIITR